MTGVRHLHHQPIVRSIVIAALTVGLGCAARKPFVPPSGTGAPAPGAAAAWEDASAPCRSIRTYRASLALTGRVGENRIRGLAGARLHIALTAEGAIGLEASVSGQPIFRLGGTSDRATLVFRDGNRVVTAPPQDILDALIGVKVAPARLLAVLTGCVTQTATVEQAALYGDMVQIATGDATIYLRPSGGHYRPRAAAIEDFTADYWTFARNVPRDLAIGSRAGRTPAVWLSLTVQDVAIDETIPTAALTIAAPADSVTMSLAELREAGPLGGSREGK